MNAREAVELFVAFGAIAGFFVGLYQYRQAQRWKRLEFAAGQLQRLTSEPDLVLAITFLEYSKMTIPLPEKYRELAKTDLFHHDSAKLSENMGLTFFESTAEYLIYREAFMRLFEYLEQLYQFIDMGLIKADDVKGVRWVLEGTARPKWIDHSVLVGHLRENFPDVIKLMTMMGVQASR